MSQSRTKNSLKNIQYSFLSYVFTLFLQFLNRTIFIRLLTSEYLGLNGLFSNVLTFLSLAEMGVGAAINYALYKPIAEGNVNLVKSIMHLYQRLYRTIGCVVLLLGFSLTPFLPFLIHDMPKDIENIYLYYLLYVLNSGVSYFFTYRRSLIICHQKEYISTITTTISKIALSVLQVLIILVTHSYAAYLIVAIFVTISENLVISWIAKKMYPYMKEKQVDRLPKEVSDDIKRNVFAIVLYKLDWVIIVSTDNLIISKFIGLVAVGLYSNYTLITNSVHNLISKIFSAITASVGNLVVSDNKENVKQVFYRLLFLNFWIRGFCSITFFCLFQPFIDLWIGSTYKLSFITVAIISIEFYTHGINSTVRTFREASGIFWNGRYMPVIESIVNIVLSVPLAIKYGISGVLLGTVGSTLLVPFWFESYILFKYYFHENISMYMAKQVLYACITFLTGLGCQILCFQFPRQTVGNFIIQLLICLILPNAIFILAFFKTKEYQYFISLLKDFIH